MPHVFLLSPAPPGMATAPQHSLIIGEKQLLSRRLGFTLKLTFVLIAAIKPSSKILMGCVLFSGTCWADWFPARDIQEVSSSVFAWCCVSQGLLSWAA